MGKLLIILCNQLKASRSRTENPESHTPVLLLQVTSPANEDLKRAGKACTDTMPFDLNIARMEIHTSILQLGSQNAAWKYIFLRSNTRSDKIPQMQTPVLTKKWTYLSRWKETTSLERSAHLQKPRTPSWELWRQHFLLEHISAEQKPLMTQ